MRRCRNITLLVLTYNQERFAKDSINSALCQDYDNLEIIISDDNSTDRTFDIISETVRRYNGPHIVRINKNKENMGVVEHLNYLVSDFLRTQLFIVQAGDDISSEKRVRSIKRYFDNNNDVHAICSNAILIDENNNEDKLYIPKDKYCIEKKDFYNITASGTQFFGASAAYDVEIFDTFGRINSNARNEDIVLPYRASLLGKIGYISEPLLKYRVHENNLSFWVQAQNTSCSDYIRILSSNYKNQIVNYENIIEDIKKIEAIDKRKIIELKINELKLRRFLLMNKLSSRIIKILNSNQKINLAIIALAISPCIYQVLSRRR